MKIAMYLLSSSVFIISSIKYMDYLLKYRVNHKWSIWIVAFTYLCITSLAYFSKTSPILNTISFFAMVVSFGCFFSNWKRTMVVAAFMIVALLISEVITFYIIELISNPHITNLSHDLLLDIGNFMTKLTFPIIIYFFAKIFRFTFSKEAIPSKYLIGCLSIPFLSIFIFYYIYSTNQEGNTPLYYSLSASIVVMAMNMMILLIFIRLTDYYNAKIANQRYIEQIDAFNNQQRNNINAITEIKQVRHDLNSILLAVKISLEDGNTGGALDAVNQHLQETNPAYFVSNTNIFPIDSIINYKNETARQAGIQIIVQSRNMTGLNINWMDICVIMSSALDNAIDACKRINTNEEITIRITIETHNRMLHISIVNPYIGKILTNGHGGYVSTKPDKENHGLGVSGIMRLLEKNNGYGEINNKDNLFELMLMVPEFK